MDIADIRSTEYTTFDADTPLSKLAGAFEDQGLDAVVVTADGEYSGVVSRRQLASSSNQPDAKAGSRVQDVPTVEPGEDVREVARLMLGADAKTLPVLEDGDLVGVVTADDVLEAVRPFLDAATVAEAYSEDLVSATPDTTVGKALNTLRERRIAHLPVLEDGHLVGMVSLYDVVDFTTRGGDRSQGGSAGDFDGRGGAGSGARHGGRGDRGGEADRMLDVPVRDLMTDVVATVALDATLDDVVETMFDREISSLVVTDGDDRPVGILTKSDLVEALTWEQDDQRPVQVFGLDLLGDMSQEAVSAIVEDLAEKYGEMTVIKASIELNEHKEESRGVSLIQARIRLVTDRGYFTADAEGYGASHAIRLAANAVERQLLKGKTYGQSKKHPTRAEEERLYGWWLGG